MAAGKIRIFKRRTEIVTGRRKEMDPVLYYSPWCDIKDLYGQELYEALDRRLENTIVFEVRYCQKIKEMKQHLKEYFIEYEGDIYDIYASDFKQNDRQYVQLKANRTD